MLGDSSISMLILVLLALLPLRAGAEEPSYAPAAQTTVVPAAENEDPAPPLPPLKPGELDELFAQLRSESFSVRDAASQRMAAVRATDLPILRAAAHKERDTETRSRILAAAREVFMKDVAPRLMKPGKGRGFLGISWQLMEVPPGPAGVSVQMVMEGRAAHQAGVRTGDIITAINGTDFKENLTRADAMDIFSVMAPGDTLKIRVIRSGRPEPFEISILVGEKPAQFLSAELVEAQKQKREEFWAQFMEDKIPPNVFTEAAQATALRSSTSTSSRTAGAIYLPLQTWPRELEGR